MKNLPLKFYQRFGNPLFQIPDRFNPNKHNSAQNKTSTMIFTKQTIMIVEDHDSIRKLIGIILGKKYNVIFAKDGLDAWAVLSQGTIPDLILLDLDMPTMNGESFLSHLRSSGVFSNLPVMVLSGTSDDDVLEDRLHKQFDVSGFVQKPFNPTNLDEQIGTAISSSMAFVN